MKDNVKQVIGMIHLKALQNAPLNSMKSDAIFEAAKRDLESLQEGGVDAAIVENYFDFPFCTEIDKTTLIEYVNIFTRLKEITKIPLGVNIQYANNEDEMLVASLCGAEFIRAETFVEARTGSFGNLKPNCAALTRCRKRLNSDVKIYADINVKHTFASTSQTIEYSVSEAIVNQADALIITGLKTGVQPSVEDVRKIKDMSNGIPIFIGSGIRHDNITDYLSICDGVIVGSSIKIDGKVELPIDKARVKALMDVVLAVR